MAQAACLSVSRGGAETRRKNEVIGAREGAKALRRRACGEAAFDFIGCE
jgi:hypothetical protein